ncbi:glycine-rich domain-containing protein [Pedobacter sp. NJ-S-72]
MMKPVFTTIPPDEGYQDYTVNPLWQRIYAYSPDNEDFAIPFSRKLAVTEGWTRRFTLLAIVEYKRFVYLCCISQNGASPSVVVDKVWHMHLLYTIEYWKKFCPQVLGRELHHYPNVGGIIEYNKHQDWYLETLKLYLLIFKENPPPDFWRIPKEILPHLLDKKIDTVLQNSKRLLYNKITGIIRVFRFSRYL